MVFSLRFKSEKRVAWLEMERSTENRKKKMREQGSFPFKDRDENDMKIRWLSHVYRHTRLEIGCLQHWEIIPFQNTVVMIKKSPSGPRSDSLHTCDISRI